MADQTLQKLLNEHFPEETEISHIRRDAYTVGYKDGFLAAIQKLEEIEAELDEEERLKQKQIKKTLT